MNWYSNCSCLVCYSSCNRLSYPPCSIWEGILDSPAKYVSSSPLGKGIKGFEDEADWSTSRFMVIALPLLGWLLKWMIKKLSSTSWLQQQHQGSPQSNSQRSITIKFPSIFCGAQMNVPPQGSQIQYGRMHTLWLQATRPVGKEHRCWAQTNP